MKNVTRNEIIDRMVGKKGIEMLIEHILDLKNRVRQLEGKEKTGKQQLWNSLDIELRDTPDYMEDR